MTGSGGASLPSRRQILPQHEADPRRLAGGDTSSHALEALEITALSYAGELAPGAALCRAHAPGSPLDSLELMLEGGQMGGMDLFERQAA
jgi:uncharacterized protein YgbK (DUF1537 family)